MTTLVLLSGGLDSAVLLWAQKLRGDVATISFDYGQRHRKELTYAEMLADRAGAEHVQVDLSDIARRLPSALTDLSLDVPSGEYTVDSLSQTVVPGRNAIFLSVAHAIAASRRYEQIVFGAHTGDHPVYRDCRPEFVVALGIALNRGSDWHVVVEAPFAFRAKHSIVMLGDQLGAPLELTWSCYEGGTYHCGECSTCHERRKAFDLADVADPTVYVAANV